MKGRPSRHFMMREGVRWEPWRTTRAPVKRTDATCLQAVRAEVLLVAAPLLCSEVITPTADRALPP